MSKYILLSTGIAMFTLATGILACDVYRLKAWRLTMVNFDPELGPPPSAPTIRWRTSLALLMLAWAPLLISAGVLIALGKMPGTHNS
jgi:hypothetical protein